jgi:dolichyl-phosphate-mannose--protein O-mannosyl transferase
MEFSDPLSKSWPHSLALYRTVALIAAVILIARVVQTMFLFPNTYDEPYHIASAVVMYDVGKLASGVEQPPLTRIVAGLPLYLRGVRLPPAELTSAVVPPSETYLQGARILFHSNLSYWQVLITARLGMLLFPLVALLYLYLWAVWIGTEFIAALSVVLFSLDPTLLGHSTWLSTDVAGCAGFLAATYHGLRWVVLGGRRRAAFTGIAIAAAIAAKFSCVFVIPVIGLLIIVYPLSACEGSSPITLRTYFHHWPPFRQMAMVAVVAFVTLWGTYLFNVDRLANQTLFGTALLRLPLHIRNAQIPMPSFPLGMMWLVAHNRTGALS